MQYEHSRVHLEAHANPTDYINASHISFNALPKRFIASQGPLENTFADFWQMCLQEHVGVIVMLTNLFEGGREKCGRYWTKQFAGPFEIKVESEDDTAAADEEAGGFFGPCSLPTDSPLQRQRRSNNTVRRTIYVKRRDEPSAPPHKIRHLQYTAWPDFDVPADPSEVLTLVREVDKANRDFANETGRSDPPPILTHCSAGVGRTVCPSFFLSAAPYRADIRSRRAYSSWRRPCLSRSRSACARSHGTKTWSLMAHPRQAR